jgi:DNA-binding NarL/FixJ family response regulator
MGRSHGTNVAYPPVLSRQVAKAARPGARSLRVERPEILVAVEAEGSLRRRIVATLEADGISIAPHGASAPTDIRVLSIDLSQPVPLRRLRAVLGNGTGRVVVVSPKCSALGLRRAVKAGADSLLLEEELEDALAPATRAVAAGLSVMPTALRGAERAAFSHREREVLRLAVTGHTNGQIASMLFLAESTVKSHLSSAYRKLGAGGRSDAARMVFDPDEGLADMVLGPVAADHVAHDGHAA